MLNQSLNKSYPDLQIRNAFVDEEVSEKIKETYLNHGTESFAFLPEDTSLVINDLEKTIVIAKKGAFSGAPLYYTVVDNYPYCSFNINDILAQFPHLKCPENKTVIEYLQFRVTLGQVNNGTFYKNIYKLLPGESLIWTKEESIRFEMSSPLSLEKILPDEQNHIAAIQKTLIDSTKCKIANKSKIAAYLSGGLDSSALNGIAQTFSENKILSLYIDTHTQAADEYHYASLVSRMHSTDLRKLSFKEDIRLKHIKQVIEITGMPESINLTSDIDLKISKECKSEGIDVILSGLLGDQVIDYGHTLFSELFRQSQWTELTSVLKSNRYSARDIKKFYITSFIKKIKSNPSIAEVKNAFKTLRKNLNYQLHEIIAETIRFFFLTVKSRLKNNTASLDGFLLNGRLDSEIKFKLHQPELLAKGTPSLTHRRKLNSIYQQIVIQGMEQQYNLFIKEKIKIAYPFFNKELIEVTLHTKDEWLLKHGTTRSTIREAFKDFYPTEVYQRRDKAVFNDYLVTVYKHLYKEFVESLGANYKSHQIWTIVNRTNFEKLSAKIRNNKIVDSQKTKVTLSLLRTIYVALWLDYINQK